MKSLIVYKIKNLSSMLALLTMIAILGFSISYVRAAIPDPDGKLNACYLNSGSLFNSKGTLRIIDSNSEQCFSNETSINWDRSGSINYGYVTVTESQDTNITYSIDPELTKGLTSFKVVLCQDLIDPGLAPDCIVNQRLAFCFDLAFQPKNLIGNYMIQSGPGQKNTYISGSTDDKTTIEDGYCGIGYDVATTDLNGLNFSFFQ